MSSKGNLAARLSGMLKKQFPKLDPGYLENVAEELVVSLTDQQRRGEVSKGSLLLRLREIPWVARELRTMREKKRLKQEDVANAMDISTSTYLRRESGIGRFTLADVMFLLDFYGVDDPRVIEQFKQAVKRK